MIPTVIAAGLIVGRWWAVPAAAIVWPLLLVFVGDCGWDCLPVAAAFGAGNAAGGVALHQLLALVVRPLLRLRRGS